MSIESEFNQQYSRLNALPPEQRSVRSTGGLLGSLAKADMNQQLTSLEQGTRRLGIENQLSNARADVRLANKDAGIALGVTALNTGLQGMSAWEKLKMQKEQDRHSRMVEDFFNAYSNEIKNNYNEYIKIATAGTSQPAELNIKPVNLPQRTLTPMPSYRGGLK